ncbi:MAG: sigma-70 family RNA polymerase sigma factor [Deltaproteobacteria bacterium]|nr:sigma-70 family RNA polymerase sigma factor [Deltaproteobacteria bacterium]
MDLASASAAPLASSERSLNLVQIYEEHCDFVWRSLQRMGVGEENLDDVFQEVFVVVHKRLHTFDGSSRMTTWLYGICLRVASSWRRRAWFRRERPVDETPERASQPGKAGDDWMATQQAQRRVREVLDRMDLDKRAVFLMFEIEELSSEEIASILGVPVGTVYSRLYNARKQFQEILSRLEARAFRGGGP